MTEIPSPYTVEEMFRMRIFHRITVSILVCLALSPALAEESDNALVRATIDATLSRGGDTLKGTVRLEISNHTGSPIEAIPLWLYPNRFKKSNVQSDQRMTRFVYPNGIKNGHMVIDKPVWNGQKLAKTAIALKPFVEPVSGTKKQDIIAMVRLDSPLDPGASGTLSLHFSVRIPKRRGRFGRWHGIVSLGGGWFPRPLSDLQGKDTALPPETIAADVRITLPSKQGAVLHDRIYPWTEKARTIEAQNIQTESLVLVTMNLMDVTEKEFPWGKVVHVHQELERKEPTFKDRADPNDEAVPVGLNSIADFSYPERMLEVAKNTAELIQKNFPNAPLPERLVMVDIPAWDRLVQFGPGPVLVSNRIWRLIPTTKVLWFHDLALARQVGAQLLWPILKKNQSKLDRYLVADMVGSSLAEKYMREIHQGSKSVKQMLGWAGFIPVIDHILYSPQVPFREVYSKSVEDPDPLRDAPWRFMNELPWGKRIFGKLEDLIGPEQTEQLVKNVVVDKMQLHDAARKNLGQDPTWFYDQWYGSYPSVNYRIGKIEDKKLPDGRWHHRVEIIRDGRSIREPVTVHITDKKKVRTTLIWDGNKGRGTVECNTAAKIKKVRKKKKNRLVEDPKLTPDSPKADNFDPLPWRPPIFTGVRISGDLLRGQPTIIGGFNLRRQYDVTNVINLSGVYSPRAYGGALSYGRSFGPKRTLNSRTMSYGPSLGVFRYQEVEESSPNLPEETRFGAVVGAIGFFIGGDNRWYAYDPLEGFGFSVSARYTLGRADDGHLVQMGKLGASTIGIFSAGLRHTFAFHVGATGLVGEPTASQLATLSVRSILKGFDVDETYGRLGFYAGFEYRHTLFSTTNTRLPIFLWFDRPQGVFFAAGGTMSYPDGYDGLFTPERIFTEVGYGLRFHLLTFGVQQFIIGFEFAYPLTPTSRQAEYTREDGSTYYVDRDPWRITWGIWQTF